ncbi:hypothetical protein NDU88_003977 [Pleurodeles waltl]|uniref:Uncharacterized protein n=1 Tax=Pleurodeles waltl TaxID=8319 RepID=A0AAV7WWD1_PLEWA|nr:hypothetical protein NDU88_003977 [Pleurodeles waltl]
MPYIVLAAAGCPRRWLLEGDGLLLRWSWPRAARCQQGAWGRGCSLAARLEPVRGVSSPWSFCMIEGIGSGFPDGWWLCGDCPVMGRHRKTDVSQGNATGQYTTAVPTPQHVTRVAGSDDGQSGLLPVEEPLRTEILAAIQGSRVALEGKIEMVAVEVNLLRADLRKISDKVKVAEGSIVELQAELGTLRKQMAQAGSTVGRLEARLENAEGRSQQNNFRLLGVLKRSEGSMVEAFVENWIRDVLQTVVLSRVFLVQTAHRALGVPLRHGAPPRAIIARLLNYRDRDCVLRAARDSNKALFENGKISIYPDFTNKVQNSQKSFLKVKAKLRAMNIRYMLLYLVRLKVLSGGRSHFVEQPEEVWRWLEMWDKAY